MTRDDIIRMALEIATQVSKAGPYRTWTYEYAMSQIMGLIDSSITTEREACAKACEARKIIDPEYEYDRHYNQAAEHCAFAIRARGEK